MKQMRAKTFNRAPAWWCLWSRWLNWDVQGWNWVSWGSWQQGRLHGHGDGLQQRLRGRGSSSVTQPGRCVSACLCLPESPVFWAGVSAFCPCFLSLFCCFRYAMSLKMAKERSSKGCWKYPYRFDGSGNSSFLCRAAGCRSVFLPAKMSSQNFKNNNGNEF